MRLVRRWLSGLLGLFFHLLYHPFAAYYDMVAWAVSLGRWKSWVFTTLAELEGPRVLELGHGPGHLQAAVNEKGIQCFGIDLSRQMGALAKGRLTRSEYAPLLARARAQNLPFATNAFDQVVATFPTEYLMASESLHEAQRVLVPEGEFIVLPVAWITGKSLAERFMAALFRVTGQAGQWNDLLSRAMAEGGFSVTEKFVHLPRSKVVLLKARKLSR